MSASRFSARNTSKNSQAETNENEFETSQNPIHYPPPRTPLNSIADPSQCRKESAELLADSLYKLEAVRGGLQSERKLEDSSDRYGNVGLNYVTPRVVSRGGKAHSEPNSAQSSPARNVSRISLGGAAGTCAGSRAMQLSGGRGGSFSKVSRGISATNSALYMEVPHFELKEDPSFWMDHNVQVLIRIRPLSTLEKVSQDCCRCLSQESGQTLVWLGHPETSFTFDHIACETISQENLFRVAGVPMVENCMSGYNSCMFAYGQTGSGKTYTMMGDISEMEGNLNEDCGITPRIFEYLFARIRAEEESRTDEKLKYSCKCSFLEIYNEQITDLLVPSSTNLQIREDMKKGVYVENLTQHNVRDVDDVLKLLSQGAANRKMAATHMNSESSRSHSVFTCIIESCWEKDSMTHFRFARLNLVDLAGSERQKSSGAEGDRLKEAANINKSLSTLGLVMMTLVDLAHGKHRHVPYRDSRLTFLLQDSLGGNSKTTIIANVSPSICSAHETLSTLKFAQRAKLIQNNAKVNEDASGDVTVLQRQIQHLKGQLAFFMTHKSFPKPMSSMHPNRLSNSSEVYDSLEERTTGSQKIYLGSKEINCMKATLVGALRREKMAEAAFQKLKDEIELMKHLARQREEKIKQLELLAEGTLSAEKYLMKENNALQEEILLLQAKIDKNPKLTSLSMENDRLSEQLELFQNFYEKGERERLQAELSELRDQVQVTLEGNPTFTRKIENQYNDNFKQLEDCRNMNFKLIREVDELRTELRKYSRCNQAISDSVRLADELVINSFSKDTDELQKSDKYSLVETISIRSDSGDEMPSYTWTDDEALSNSIEGNGFDASVMEATDTQKELESARLIIEAMESEQVSLINEMNCKQKDACRFMEMQNMKAEVEGKNELNFGNHDPNLGELDKGNKQLSGENSEDNDRRVLQAKMDKMSKVLEEVRLCNDQYQEKQALQLSQQHQIELVCEEVEMETTRTILHLQEEITALQSEFPERLHCMAQENTKLRNMVAEKEEAIKALCLEWERATMELTTFLVDGSRSLRDASGQVEGIVSSFPQVSDWIGEHVGRAVKVYVEKEETIQLLQKSLEDAQKMVVDMERKISSLKGVTVALSESQQLEGPERMDRSMLLSEMTNMVRVLESEVRLKEDQVTQAEKRADAVFLVVKWLCDRCDVAQASDVGGDSLMPRLDVDTRLSGKTNSSVKYLSLKDLKAKIETIRLGLLELESAACAFCANTDMPSAGIQTDFCSVSSVDRDLIQDFAREIQELTTKLRELKKYCKTSQHCVVESLTTRACEKCNFENQNHILNQIREELAETNRRLGIIENTISTGGDIFRCPLMDRKLADADAWSADSSSSDSVSSTEAVGYDNKFDGSSYTCNFRDPASILQIVHPKAARGSKHEDDHIESESSGSLWETSIQNEAAILCLKKELDALYDAFSKLHVQVASLLKISKKGKFSYGKDACSTMPELEGLSPSSALRTAKTEAGGPNDGEVFEELKPAGSFFTKFEESHATIEEADLLLNALVKSNENAKQVTVVWKQAGEDLMIERASLTEEIQQLKSSISYQQKENQLLADHLDNTLVEISNSISFLEDCFLQMQIDVEKRFEVLCSDFFLTRQQMLYSVSEWRSSVEDIFFQIMEKGFVSFILYYCLIEKFICKFPCLDINHDANLIRLEEVNNLTKICSSNMGYKLIPSKEIREGRDQCVRVKTLQGERDFSNAKLINENLTIRKELERKEELLEGLLFDFRLLQESTSNTMDIKDETEKLIFSSRHVRNELEMKTSQLDNMLIQHRELEVRLADTEKALFVSRSELVYANEKIHKFLDQIGELRELVKDLFTRKSEAEEQLEEQKEVIWGLEQELLQLNTSEEKNYTSLEGIEDELRRVIGERDQLLEEVRFLSDKLEMAYALAEENEAISVEARQESEASKQYAEEKEEEVKILENSVEELESTIHVLEKKVFEMDEEVGRHRLIRESLEVELQAFRQRLLTIERLPQNTDSESTSVQQAEGKISRQLSNKLLELHEAHNRIKVLEEEREDQDKEIKQCKEYISEVVLHAEAQASQYQQKYKTMESMFREVKAELSNSVSSAPTADKIEKTPLRTRGSSSPFRCIASLVQQMNLEKDQELSMARHHIEELEALAASRQKEVCVLNTRLAAAESMTHDVIRDLLGVKLDMTNYANLIDQHQVLKLVEEAHQHTDDFFAKEEEILYLRKQIDDLLKERESCILELKNREADNFATQITVQQLQERHQLLFAQNEILKMDKTNLMKKVVDLDDMVKTLLVTPSIQQHNQQISKIKDKSFMKQGDVDFTKRLSHPGRLVSRVNHELKYRQAGGSNQRG